MSDSYWADRLMETQLAQRDPMQQVLAREAQRATEYLDTEDFTLEILLIHRERITGEKL